MEVDDLNITLASGAANAAAANGAGITVDGASATITYDGTNDEWDFNKNINVTGTIDSGAITSTGTSEFASLNLGGVTSTASSFLSGTQRIVSDGYIATQAIYNYSETGASPAAIVFGNGATYGIDQISLITSGVTALYIDSAGDIAFANNATGAALIKGVSGNQSDVAGGGTPQYTFVGNEGTGVRRPAANTLAFDAGGSENMRIHESGGLSIDTTNIPASTSGALVLANGGAGGPSTYQPGGGLWIENVAGTPKLALYRAGGDALRLDGGGTSDVYFDNSGDFGFSFEKGAVDLLAIDLGASGKIDAALPIHVTTGGGTTPFRVQGGGNSGVNIMEVGYAGGGVGANFIIDDNAYVGIGTDNPLSKLDVAGNVRISDGSLEFDKPSVYGFRFLQNDAGNDLSIQQGDVNNANYETRLNIGSTGNVGIGTDNPSEILHIVGGGNGPEIRLVNSSSSHYIRAYNDNWNFLANTTNTAITIKNSGAVENNVQLTVGGTQYDTEGNLVVYGHGQNSLIIQTSENLNDRGIAWRNSGGAYIANLYITDVGSNIGAMVFGVSDAVETVVTDVEERMRISTEGNLLINTTSKISFPTNKAAAAFGIGGEVNLKLSSYGSAHTFQQFILAGSVIGSISGTSSATSYNTSSDYRLKENVDYEFTALDRVAQLKPARFNFIDDADTTVDGFLAHEVQDIVPEAITGEKDAVKEEEYEITPAVLDDDGNVVTEAEMGTREVPEYQGIDHSKLVPLLTKAMQEQQTIIENLQSRLDEAGL
jgi:hypothetical protein